MYKIPAKIAKEYGEKVRKTVYFQYSNFRKGWN